MTDRASYITVEGNRIEGSGDDGIAVVSYTKDGALSHHITARNNTVIGNKWGRSMSVVGGSDVLYENNTLENSGAYTCMYLAQENSWNTYGAKNVVVQRNTFKNCGSTTTGHGAIMVFSDGQDTNNNISLIRNDITQNGQAGIRVFSAGNVGIIVDSNRVQGAGKALDITTPGVALTQFVSGLVGAVAQ
jgi:hypothetical protein